MLEKKQTFKALSKICLNNWHYIDRKILSFSEGVNFFTGHSGSGKSTVIDAIQIVLYANTDGRGFFNKAAADDSDRSLIEYLRGMVNIGENNESEYLRNKNFSSTIVLEFEQTDTREKQCVGVVFDVETSTNEIGRLFFWHTGGLLENQYRADRRCLTTGEVREYLQRSFPSDQYYCGPSNERFRRQLYDIYLGGLDMEKFPRLFKRAIPFRMNIKLEDFVKEYICMEKDIHIEDLQESVMQYGRMRSKIEETMREVAARYADAADAMNETRSEYLDESTVIFVLNESFSDPSRVPGIELNQEATPEVDAIREQTTGGLMLSSGYGGGTANLEYMSLTGMSMANFNSSLTSPYQQLVPSQRWTTSVNQMWGDAENSLGFHPYEPSMYSRATNYRKFGFSHFYTLEGDDVIAHQDKIGTSPYVSDEATYQSVLDEVSSTDTNQFISVITMQNHMPYNDWYSDNEFTVTNTDGAEPLGEDETREIETYAKGVSLSDKATAEFLDELDAIDKPITVVFYGDHLPGIYSTAGEDQNNSLALHLTDYFIWSNKASSSQGTKNENSDYTSPNYFIAQAAEHMNAKVSPFLAFLTQMHEHVSAMEPPVVNNIQGWDRIPEGQPIYLDADGNPMVESEMDAATRQLLEDYKLIQYDVTAGDGYLKDLGFMDAPER